MGPRSSRRCVFVTGATGYMGARLLPLLVSRGHKVRALVRPGSESRVPPGCEVVSGDALRRESFAARVPPADTFVQLVGIAHPSPSKSALFREVDLASAKASAEAAAIAGVAHFVYVSVAQPSPVMKAYQETRAEAETFIRARGLNATFLRPWYVLGPGHRWPYLLLPAYWIAERIPSTRDTARRLGLVTIRQMLAALVQAVENPAHGIRVLEVPDLRGARI